jgi:hypothetical protein
MPHDNRARRDENVRYGGLTGTPGTSVVPLSVLVNEQAIQNGSCANAPSWTIGGADRWAADLLTNATKFSALMAGLADGGALSSVLSAGQFNLDATKTVLTLSLAVGIAAYSIGADRSYVWTFPEQAFLNRAGALAVTSAIVVVNS